MRTYETQTEKPFASLPLQCMALTSVALAGSEPVVAARLHAAADAAGPVRIYGLSCTSTRIRSASSVLYRKKEKVYYCISHSYVTSNPNETDQQHEI